MRITAAGKDRILAFCSAATLKSITFEVLQIKISL
jgi:hypothetical protein